jgi:hypothetical protein
MRLTKKMAVASGIVSASLASGIAFAAWTADGTGSGYAQAKTAQAVSTADATADTAAGLYPGGTSDLKVRVTNPNDYAVTVTAINNGTGSILSGDATCDASNGVTFTNTSGLTSVVPAHSLGTLITLTGKVAMSNASVTACSGKTFTVPVSILAASS